MPESPQTIATVGYKLTRDSCPGWMFLGTTPEEVARTIKNEFEMHEGLDPDEIESMTIEPFWIMQEEIDNMPEFQGW